MDNFQQISRLLKFESNDDFYFLQIIKRKKEHPELGSNSIVIKTYYVKSIESLFAFKPEIIALCKHHNARAGINLNRRSFEKLAFQTLKKISDQILNKDFSSVKNAYASVTGAYSNEVEKKWIVDIDEKNHRFINEVMKFIDTLQPEGNKFITLLETKNGFHLITKPFNLAEFKKQYELDVHKDNPTNLYSTSV